MNGIGLPDRRESSSGLRSIARVSGMFRPAVLRLQEIQEAPATLIVRMIPQTDPSSVFWSKRFPTASNGAAKDYSHGRASGGVDRAEAERRPNSLRPQARGLPEGGRRGSWGAEHGNEKVLRPPTLYKGMFPCFLGGFLSRFVLVISRPAMIRRRVCRGSITSSMKPRSAAT